MTQTEYISQLCNEKIIEAQQFGFDSVTLVLTLEQVAAMLAAITPVSYTPVCDCGDAAVLCHECAETSYGRCDECECSLACPDCEPPTCNECDETAKFCADHGSATCQRSGCDDPAEYCADHAITECQGCNDEAEVCTDHMYLHCLYCEEKITKGYCSVSCARGGK